MFHIQRFPPVVHIILLHPPSRVSVSTLPYPPPPSIQFIIVQFSSVRSYKVNASSPWERVPLQIVSTKSKIGYPANRWLKFSSPTRGTLNQKSPIRPIHSLRLGRMKSGWGNFVCIPSRSGSNWNTCRKWLMNKIRVMHVDPIQRAECPVGELPHLKSCM